jgi:hypothetical protein
VLLRFVRSLNGYFNTLAKNVCWDYSTGVGPGSSDEDLIKYFPTDCPQWGKTSLPWSDAMGAVFISGWVRVLRALRAYVVCVVCACALLC